MHNHKVLNYQPNETGIKNCNCRNKATCPLPKSCQTKCIVYQGIINCDIAGYKQKRQEITKKFWEVNKRSGITKIT